MMLTVQHINAPCIRLRNPHWPADQTLLPDPQGDAYLYVF